MKIAIIGNPENRRIQHFIQAADKVQQVIVLPYQQALTNPACISEVLDQVDFLKIESSGENFEVFKKILSWGAPWDGHNTQNYISKDQIASMSFDKGLIQYTLQWSKGLANFYTSIQQSLVNKNIKLLNIPKAIMEMSDKAITHEILEYHQVAKVPFLGWVKNYDHMRSLMQELGVNRVFLKLANASSASGVMAYQYKGNQELMISSAKKVIDKGEIKIYNSLKVNRYESNQDIKDIIDTLSHEALLMEKWIPKCSFEGRNYDLRVVVINGKAGHTVMRSSNAPMTNLHLGNERGNLVGLKRSLGADKWQEIEALAIKAVAAFAGATVAGVDILLTGPQRMPKVIEVNPFGDLLPNINNNLGYSTYEAQMIFFKDEFNKSDII